MDWSFIIIILQLIFLEGVLSIDNAAILGAMVVPLSDHLPIQWPRALQRLGHVLNPLLGNQRTAALRVGLLGAYLGRGLMLVLASLVIHNPWLKLIGALYLVRLAIDSLSSDNNIEDEREGEGTKPVKTHSFWITVLNVELMDLVFSLDNVVAAVSLSDKLWVVMLGVAIGILTMRFAAGIFSLVMEREPILKQAAYILVFTIGVELLLEDFAHVEIGDWTRFGISVSIILLTLAYEKIHFLKVFRPLLVWISRGFWIFNLMIDWILDPFKAILRGVWNILRSIFKPVSQAVE